MYQQGRLACPSIVCPHEEVAMCTHQPTCPPPEAPDRDAARVVAAHQEQGWSLLCNGVIAFDDLGDLLPDGRALAPQPGADAGRQCRRGASSPRAQRAA
jgi:hypothetical protein